MPSDAPAGRHAAARHRGPSAYERARDKVCDAILAVPTPSLGRVGGRVVAATAVGGVLATGAVLGTQAALTGGSTPQNASADVDALIADAGSAADPTATSDEARGTSGQRVSRDAARPSLDEAKQKAQAATDASTASARIATKTSKVDVSDPRAVAKGMLGDFGWDQGQFGCLDSLWVGESNWRVNADNPSSSAYGIPQALPGSKMATEGDDWQTNPVTQIRWGLKYIDARYGSPCDANGFKQGNGWY